MTEMEKPTVDLIEDADIDLKGDVPQLDLQLAQAELLGESKGIWQTFKEDRRAVLCVLAALSNAFILGADTNIGGSLVGSQAFCKVMGNGYMENGVYAVTPEVVTIWNAVAAPPQVLGQFCMAYFADKWGRRTFCFALLGLMIFAIVLELVSFNWQTFAASKFFIAFVMGLLQALAPTYVSELAPRSIRGILMAWFPTIGTIGNLISTFVMYGCEQRWPSADNKWAYRVPLLYSLVLPLLVGVMEIFWLAESPYWQVMKGKLDGARKTIKFMYPNRTDEQRELILAEYQYTLLKEAEKEELSKDSSYLACFKGIDLRRTFCAIFPAATMSMTGNTLVGPQATYFFTLAGQTDSLRSTCISLAVGFVAYILAIMVVENKKIGRFRLLIFGQCLMVFAMFGVGGTATGYDSPYAAKAGKMLLGFICMGVVGANMGPGVAGWNYMAESGSARLRAKTTSIGNLGNGIIGVVYNVAVPYMLTSSFGLRGTGYWFGAWGFVGLALSILFIPDYTGRSYPQIDELFLRKIPARQFCNTECTGNYGNDILHQN